MLEVLKVELVLADLLFQLLCFRFVELGLRFLYTEALTGKRELVNQELAISLEELSQTLVSLLGMMLPASTAERVHLLRELRKHRLVRFREADAGFGQMEMLLGVLRPILSFVSDEALLEVHQQMQKGPA